MRFGDVPVLAEKAAHVAARGTHGKHARARQEMVQRLFFDGIDLQRSGCRISEAVELAALIRADKAKAALPFPDVAVPGTQIAMHAPLGHGLPPAGLVQGLSFLEYFQVLHSVSVCYRLGRRPGRRLNRSYVSCVRKGDNFSPCILYHDGTIPIRIENRGTPRTYSYRSATIGSILAARRAGIHTAVNATTASIPTAANQVSGSVAGTP